MRDPPLGRCLLDCRRSPSCMSDDAASLPDSSSSEAPPDRDAAPEGGALGELARLFLKLGIVAFGGPAAHIAMMEDEVVSRRQWIDRQHFLDLVGATNLIPGPNSTEMTMHVGYERAGWPGLFVAGACFLTPAVLITGGFAWLYVQYGTLPAVEPWLYGIKPAVIAVILGAVWRLGRSAVTSWRLGLIGTAVAAASFGVFSEIAALAIGGIVGMVWLRYTEEADPSTADRFLPILFLDTGGIARDSTTISAAGAAAAAGGVSLWKLGFFFLKVGSILYGSGYVLVAFLEGDLVQGYGWLTQTELLDAVAIGQLTPGPVVSTSTFIGYLIEGVPGAIVATLGIFLPSFLFVLLLNPVVPRLRESAWTAAFLDAVNVSAVGLMAAVTVKLGLATLVSWPAWLIAGLATVLALGVRVNAAWLVVGAALLGRFLAPWAGF